MAIDPVVLLAEELRSVEVALSKAIVAYNKSGMSEDGNLVNKLLKRVKTLLCELFDTVPTSAIGASELISIAAQRLSFANSRYAIQLHNIADRLSMGRRDQADLIWLRAMQAGLLEGVCGKEGERIAPLINLAIIGASKPVTVFRSVSTHPGQLPWQNILEASAG